MPLFPCDTNLLMRESRCFDKCIPPGAQREVALYLLCQWAQAASAPTPVPPPPPAPEFSYDPTNASIDWLDDTGFHLAPDLATFYLNAHIPLVSLVRFPGAGTINSITNLSYLPSLDFLDCSFQNLTSLDCTGMVNLTTLDCSSNSIDTLTLDISKNPLLAVVIIGANFLPSTVINNFLITLDANGLSNGFFQSEGQIPPAPPSGTGAVAAANLAIKNWTILTD